MMAIPAKKVVKENGEATKFNLFSKEINKNSLDEAKASAIRWKCELLETRRVELSR